MTGNINSCSKVLKNNKCLKLIQDYNDMTVGLEMLNVEKDVNAKESQAKKVEEAAKKENKNAAKNVEEHNIHSELLPGFQLELKKNTINEILSLPDIRMRQYIRYFFQKKVVNLSKIKKAELKAIISPLLQQYYESVQTTSDLVASIFTGNTTTPSPDSVKYV